MSCGPIPGPLKRGRRETATPATDSMASEGHTSRQPVSLIQTTPRGRFSVAQSTLIHTNPQGVGTIY
jgi:hypothetical protein